MEALLEEPSMPLSEPIEAVGALASARHGFVLRTDGGGVWELGHVRGARKLLGHRVRVEGSRCGFNAIACHRMWREGEPRPRNAIFDFETLIVAVLMMAGMIVGASMLFG